MEEGGGRSCHLYPRNAVVIHTGSRAGDVWAFLGQPRQRSCTSLWGHNPNSQPRIVGSLLSSGVAFDPKGQGYQEATRAGAPIYAGYAYGFDTWKLRVMSPWASLAAQGGGDEEVKRQDRDRVQYASKVLEGLTDCAFRIAEDFNMRTLIHTAGCPKLVKAIEEYVKNKKDQELSRIKTLLPPEVIHQMVDCA